MTQFDTNSIGSVHSSSVRQGAKKPEAKNKRNAEPNPIYGYRTVSIKATAPGTTIYRLRASFFREFLHPNMLKNWHEKAIESKFPTQFNFESASKKAREQMLNAMSIKAFEPGDIILKAGTMPDNLMFLISGKIQVI